MTKSVCPTTSIAAPIESVWALLTTPASYGDWWDATTERIVPDGPAAPGQIVYARAHALGMLHLPVTVTVKHVDAANHSIKLTTCLPLGITVHNHIACAPVAKDITWLQFG
ncbi:MAG TPA: SRPBCC family protein [Ktedonobacterales bacterium]